MTDKAQIIESLFSRRRAGIKPGLERMHLATEMLEHPENACKVIHIAGTNGKGSTASMISSCLVEAGFKVGLFTSPHIIEFRERYIINGVPVSDEQWIASWLEIEEVCDKLDLTFFEISALLAFTLFKNEKCDWIVLETGLGGRLDATNIVTPELSIITSLSIEHTEYLGDTIEEITGEKLGIVKKHRPFVLNPSNPKVVFELARKRSDAMESPLHIAGYPDFLGQKGVFQELQLDGVLYELPLAGEFQQYNMAAAVTAMRLLSLDEETIQEGIRKVFIPARLQRIAIGNRTFVFDVAHNPQALEILTASLKVLYPDSQLHFLVGMMKDKELRESMKILDRCAASINTITPSIPRACGAEELIKYSAHTQGEAYDTVVDAIGACKEKEGIAVVTGSFYTVCDVMTTLRIDPYGSTANLQER